MSEDMGEKINIANRLVLGLDDVKPINGFAIKNNITGEYVCCVKCDDLKLGSEPIYSKELSSPTFIFEYSIDADIRIKSFHDTTNLTVVQIKDGKEVLPIPNENKSTDVITKELHDPLLLAKKAFYDSRLNSAICYKHKDFEDFMDWHNKYPDECATSGMTKDEFEEEKDNLLDKLTSEIRKVIKSNL